MKINIEDCTIKYKKGCFTIIDSYKVKSTSIMLNILDRFFKETHYYTDRKTEDLINE